ncbi:MAG TPA: hypothetical protein VG406_19500 [Isosphaeraceae bacterium]|nr:hypothetical protein [Isosphaeraceae bacterium]
MAAEPTPTPTPGRPEPKGLLTVSFAILALLVLAMVGIADRRRPRQAEFIAPLESEPEPRAAGHEWGIRLGPDVDARIVVEDDDHPKVDDHPKDDADRATDLRLGAKGRRAGEGSSQRDEEHKEN